MSSRPTNHWGLFGVVFAAGAIYIASFYAFAFDYVGGRDGRLAFLESAEYRIWHGMVAGQVTLWFLLLRQSAEARQYLRSRSPRVVAVTTIALLLFAVWSAIQTPASTLDALHAKSPLPQHNEKVLCFVLLGLAAAAFPVSGLAGAWMRMSNIDEIDFERFVAFRKAVQRMVTVLGVMIGATVITTGALYQATVAKNPEAKITKDLVVAYGLTFFLLTLLIYFPVHARLLEVASRIKRRLLPAEAFQTAESLRDWQERRKAVDDYLGMGLGALGTLQAATAVAAPLLATLPALIMGAK
jgi:hypothetical protein